jgi:hypothetical protein
MLAAERSEVVEVDVKCAGRFRLCDLHAALAQRVKRAHDRVVLERPGYHPVARFKQPFQRQAQRVGAVQGENDPLGSWRVEQAANLLTGLVNNALRIYRHPVRAATRVGAVFAHCRVDGAIDFFRLWPGRRCVVQIDCAFGHANQPPMYFP